MTIALPTAVLALNKAYEENARLARRSFNDFVPFVLQDNNGVSLRQGTIHRVWQVHINYCWQAGRYPAILAPWAHGKSSQLVVGMIPWLLGHNPQLRTKVVCNSDSKATERVMGISTILRLPAYQYCFPGVREVPKGAKGKQSKWTQREIFLDRAGQSIDPSVQAAGILSSGIGGRADLIVFDDVVDEKNAIQEPANRDKVIGAVDNTWMSRLEPQGRVIYVGTPWHQGDHTHAIRANPAWCVLRMFISEDFQRIEMEVYNPPPGYPLPKAGAYVGPQNGRARVTR